MQVSLFIDSLIACTVSVPPTKFEEIAQKWSAVLHLNASQNL